MASRHCEANKAHSEVFRLFGFLARRGGVSMNKYPGKPCSRARGSVTTTPGLYLTHCTEVLLLPLAYILHTVRKCYCYPWLISYTPYGSVTATPGLYLTHCTEVLLLPLACILHTVRKCYCYPWLVSYTLYGSVTATPGLYLTHCTEVLLLPLACILHTVRKCYCYPWLISYTLYGSVTATPGLYLTHCTEVLLLPLAYILHTVRKCNKSCVLLPTYPLDQRVSGDQTAETRPNLKKSISRKFPPLPVRPVNTAN